VPFYELQYQFLPKNKFLKIEFVTRFHHSPYNQVKETILCQDCVKQMLVTANIYYIVIVRKYIYFIIINIYNYIFLNIY